MSTFTPPAPPALVVPVAYGGGTEGAEGRGSYGPVIAMLAVVVVLAAAAVAVGRLCFGRGGRAPGHAGGHHDLEAWVERTCGPCVGATPQAKDDEGGGGSGAAAATQPPPEGADRGESTSGSAC